MAKSLDDMPAPPSTSRKKFPAGREQSHAISSPLWAFIALLASLMRRQPRDHVTVALAGSLRIRCDGCFSALPLLFSRFKCARRPADCLGARAGGKIDVS